MRTSIIAANECLRTDLGVFAKFERDRLGGARGRLAASGSAATRPPAVELNRETMRSASAKRAAFHDEGAGRLRAGRDHLQARAQRDFAELG